MKFFRIISLLALAVYICVSIWKSGADKSGVKDDKNLSEIYRKQLVERFGDFEGVKRKKKFVWEVLAKNGSLLGILYLEPYGDDQRLNGYAGKIELAALTDSKGKVLTVLLGRNKETPSFIDYIKENGFLTKWNNLGLADVDKHQVDAVSGATFSSLAIAHGIKKLASLHSHKNKYHSEKSFRFGNVFLILWIVLMLVIIQLRKAPKYRKYIQLLNLIVIGLILRGLFSIKLLGNIAGGHYSQLYLGLAFIIVLLVTWWKRKNLYCAYMCPFGTAQDLASSITGKRKLKLSYKWQKFLKITRSIIFLSILTLLISGFPEAFDTINPFRIFYANFELKDIATIFAIMILFSAVFTSRPWCKSSCPVGDLIDNASQLNRPKRK